MKKGFSIAIDSDSGKPPTRYVVEKGRDISVLVGAYLRTRSEDSLSKKSFSAKVTRLLGAIELPEDFDYKKALATAIRTAANS